MDPEKINSLTKKLTTEIGEFIKGKGYEIARVGNTRTSSQWRKSEFKAQTKEIAFIITVNL